MIRRSPPDLDVEIARLLSSWLAVDDALEERMEKHPEITWNEVTRQAIRNKIQMISQQSMVDFVKLNEVKQRQNR